ncbi:MAG TPA: winged helix DNA-binding protein [Stellaceae bacterium]|nr:winged helix DNA-binding protein [Stellaceae bacterium]
MEALVLNAYRDVIGIIESMHRRFLEVVKVELDQLGVRDINNVQAMILFRLGDAEMTIGELMYRGCYLGSNISYNLKGMVTSGYVLQERSMHDRRSTRVRLSEKGAALSAKIAAMHERHFALLQLETLKADDLVGASKTLKRLERYWMQAVQLGVRAAALSSAA